MSSSYFLPQRFSNNYASPLADGGLIDQLFNASFPWKILKTFSNTDQNLANFMPKLDIFSDKDNYTINVEIPGVNCDDVKLEVKNGFLILSGEKKNEKTEDDGKQQHIVERSWGSFYRELRLPEDADNDNIQASHKDGVLNITIPRLVQKDSNKSITINRK